MFAHGVRWLALQATQRNAKNDAPEGAAPARGWQDACKHIYVPQS